MIDRLELTHLRTLDALSRFGTISAAAEHLDVPARLLPCDGVYEIALPKYPPGYGVVAALHPNAQHDPFMTWLLDRVKARLAAAT